MDCDKALFSFRFFANQLPFRSFFVQNARHITEKGPFLSPLFDHFSVIFVLNTLRPFSFNFQPFSTMFSVFFVEALIS